ncbi:extracellular solute-binding protein (family 5) [Ureibacillus acetophenoni]|uniref:Extracellular solute-binding protein (Family 5) n=1 Tax=Ureibacillus acetophenoni TaxID=614649 RepID=A0A285UHH1_9BACL|nr:extracellular solute-binding protein (family 5) [Ureibacillus acetophenoni]
MKKTYLIVIMAFLLVLSACSNNSEGTSTSTADNGKTTDQQSEKKVLVIANGNDMVSFDIHNHNNTSTEAIHVNMFDYLVRNTGDGFEGVLVESFENIDDTTWSFKLKEGVTFHDGSPLTAEDVKFSLERAAKDNTLLEHGSYKQIKEVVVKSELEFDIVTENPEPALLNRISRIGSGILPKN